MRRGLVTPDLFKIVELPHFRPEQMDDDIADINQHPVRIWQPFYMRLPAASGLELPDDMIGQRSDMPGRSAGCYDHLVSNGGLAFKGNDEQRLGLVVFQCFNDCARQGVNVFNRGGGGGKRPL